MEWPESGQWVVLFEPSSTDLVVLDLPEVIDWGTRGTYHKYSMGHLERNLVFWESPLPGLFGIFNLETFEFDSIFQVPRLLAERSACSLFVFQIKSSS